MLLALAVTSVMAAPNFMAGSIYAAALGAGLGVLHVVQGAGLAEHFGTRHLGTIRGTVSVFGICERRQARCCSHGALPKPATRSFWASSGLR